MKFRDRLFSSSSATFVVAVPVLLAMLGGCARRQASESIVVGNPRHGAGDAIAGNLVDISAIARSPAYRQAVLAFSGKDYRGALRRIDALLETPDLSPSAQAFLHRQQVLCQDALTGHRGTPATAGRMGPQAVVPARPVRSAADADCGPRALLIAGEEMQVPPSKLNLAALRSAAGTTADGTSMAGLTKAAQSIGLTAEGVQMDRDALSNLTMPAIAWIDGNHYIAVLSVHHSLLDPSVNGDTATVHDPNERGKEEMPLGGPRGLLARSGGMLLVLSQDGKLTAAR